MGVDCNSLNTGDVVLFYDADSLISRTIAYFDGSDCSHVGFVIKDPSWLPSGVYLLESSYDTFPSAEGDDNIGVRISLLSEVIAAYPSKNIHVRRLLKPHNWTADDIAAIHRSVHGVDYDMDPTHWVEFALGMHGKRTTKEYQCAALVSYVYVRLGLLPKDYDWTFATPACYGARLDLMPFCEGVQLGEIEGRVEISSQ